MLNKNQRFEIISMKLSKYKILFRKYPVRENNHDVIYFIEIYKRCRNKDESTNKLKKFDYANKIFDKVYGVNDKFEYSFDSEGMWKCLNDVIDNGGKHNA